MTSNSRDPGVFANGLTTSAFPRSSISGLIDLLRAVSGQAAPIPSALRLCVANSKMPRKLAIRHAQATEFDTDNHPTRQLLKTQDKIAWLGVRDGMRNWLITAA
jgi:hypothetical protein